MKGSEFCFCFWYTLWPQRTYLISKAFIFCDLYSRRMALQCLLTTAVAVSCICLLASAHRNLIPCHCRRRVLSVCSFLHPIQRGFLGCRKTDSATRAKIQQASNCYPWDYGKHWRRMSETQDCESFAFHIFWSENMGGLTAFSVSEYGTQRFNSELVIYAVSNFPK